MPNNMGKFSMQGIITQNFPFYTFQDVDLKSGDNEIPTSSMVFWSRNLART